MGSPVANGGPQIGYSELAGTPLGSQTSGPEGAACAGTGDGALGFWKALRQVYGQAAYGAKYDKAVECLTKDRERLLTFYDFPAEYW